MKTFRRKNFAFKQPPVMLDGDKFVECNFTQEYDPENRVALEDLTGVQLTFESCNLTNVLIDSSWTILDCNTAHAPLPEPEAE